MAGGAMGQQGGGATAGNISQLSQILQKFGAGQNASATPNAFAGLSNLGGQMMKAGQMPQMSPTPAPRPMMGMPAGGPPVPMGGTPMMGGMPMMGGGQGMSMTNPQGQILPWQAMLK